MPENNDPTPETIPDPNDTNTGSGDAAETADVAEADPPVTPGATPGATSGPDQSDEAESGGETARHADGHDDGDQEHPEARADEDWSPEATEVTYEHTGTGHRVTRRTVRRRKVNEHTTETITEDYPVLYAPPRPAGTPAPVG